ncbi:hypothetical protein BJD99_01000 [Rhodococcus sp. 1163]|uniref:hypothetical protein n=1 Tax=Rhodococcus sp. 1163 TaxID=1905289 RepID=UPI0009FEAD94|nr:hypothetical protein [Rhodococcus sp. 1163]ORI11749.1 hypothetical protein BJD99_01000 [Rhodococcus sp. 1163]
MTDTLEDILDESFTAISSLVAAESANDQPAKFSALLRYRQADAQLCKWYDTTYGAIDPKA